jgi:hypothetical protein
MAITRHPKIFIGKIAGYPKGAMTHALGRLRILSENSQEEELRRFLNELLPEARLKISDHINTKSSLTLAERITSPLLLPPTPNQYVNLTCAASLSVDA